MNVQCQCGACHFQTPTPKPMALYHCHCSMCRRQSGSAFGTSAIFPTFTLPLDTQPIREWTRPTQGGATMHCYFCGTCGTRLMHARRGNPKVEATVSVKGGCIEGLDWKGGAEHIWCEDAVVDMSIPDRLKQWPQEPDD